MMAAKADNVAVTGKGGNGLQAAFYAAFRSPCQIPKLRLSLSVLLRNPSYGEGVMIADEILQASQDPLTNKGKEAVPQKTPVAGWLAQIMVLLNGLIITMTAFITLNLFITNIQTNKMVSDTTRIEAAMRDKMDLLQRDMELLKSMAPYAPMGHIRNILEKDRLAGLSQASLIAWKDAVAGSAPKVLYDTAEMQNSSWKIIPALSNMTDHQQSNGFSTFFVNDPTTKTPMAFFISPLIDEKISHTPQGYLIVIFQARNILKWSEFTRLAPHLTNLRILDVQNGSSLANYGESNTERASRDFTIKFGSYEWKITLQFQPSEENQILTYVPPLMLFFGLTLTLIGTLYVRSNQMNTRKLSQMNEILRDKNVDIRKQMERTAQLYNSLRASERDYSAVINSVNDVIFETDRQGRIVFLNDAWTRLTGLDTMESLGKSLFDYLQDQDRIEPMEALEKAFLDRNGSYRALVRLRSKENRHRFVEITFSLIRVDDAGNARLVGTLTDIEERRQAEIALREAERRYRTIVENAVSGLFQTSVDGRLISANQALAKLMGYESPNELLRDPLFNKSQMYASEKEKDLLLRLVKRQGQVKSFEARYKRKNGEVFWGNENLRAVTNESGEILYYEGSIDDISQRKEAEIAMQQARLESDLANRAKTEFLANMSHELRTPLNAIIGFSDIIHQESFGAIAIGAYVDYAKEINQGGKQLLKIINEILEVSKIELSEKPAHETTIDLRKVTDNCLSLVRGKGEEKMIVIETALAPQLPIIIGSETAFKQMLLNLLHNALAHTPTGGHISVESVLDQDHSVRLSVIDDGAGMDAEDVRRALQPLDEPHSGLVLDEDRSSDRQIFGLSLVRSLIAQHDGRLEIVSHKGIGTTATLIIPPSRVAGILDKNQAIQVKNLSS